jgi:hypothetical protein
MLVVERIFRMATERLGVRAMQSRLDAEGVPPPKADKRRPIGCLGRWWIMTSTGHIPSRR